MHIVARNTPDRCDVEHLCYLLSQGFHLDDARAYQTLIENPRFRCRHCGRTAANRKNLCLPVPLQRGADSGHGPGGAGGEAAVDEEDLAGDVGAGVGG
jgi:hypothetical protein